MLVSMKETVLVLNRNWYPVGVADVKATFGNIFSEVVHPVDIEYTVDDDGNKTDEYSSLNVVKDVDAWLNLPIRSYDDYMQTVRGPIRIPAVVTCANYDGIPYKQVSFPSKGNILKRDNYICGYTGMKLSKDQQSIDHIFPKSRCAYNPNTWENQVCCHRELNTYKGDCLPEEVDLTGFNPRDPDLANWVASHGKRLKLLGYPTKPKNGLVFSDFLDDWAGFLKSM